VRKVIEDALRATGFTVAPDDFLDMGVRVSVAPL